ncbi:MAG: D-2-hydroxyacid dehydrogenase [Clostridia bacterium]|nr:D-2-hydroxyacid dehydrogenase [Clostridia bacterium]
MKTVVLDGFAVNPGDLSWDFLSKYGEYTVYDKTPYERAAEVLCGADIVFTNRVKIDRAVLDACPTVKYISALGTGYDMIDVEQCRKRGIEVCNVPDYSTPSVAQLAFTLLLSLTTDIAGLCNIVKEGKWTGIPGFEYQRVRFTELKDKTVGVYGCGAIGKCFAGICKAFGMRVLAYRRSVTPQMLDGIEYTDEDTLLRESNYISFHCPLTDETRGLVDSKFICRMKPGAIIINTSRGAVLNEEDVARALHEGRLGGAGLDVLATEPADPKNPLLTSPRCLITPHSAWTSIEARMRLIDVLDKNLSSFVETGKGINRVF